MQNDAVKRGTAQPSQQLTSYDWIIKIQPTKQLQSILIILLFLKRSVCFRTQKELTEMLLCHLILLMQVWQRNEDQDTWKTNYPEPMPSFHDETLKFIFPS